MYELLNTALKQTPKELRRYNLQFHATVLSYESVSILLFIFAYKNSKIADWNYENFMFPPQH